MSTKSELFTVRIWREAVADNHEEVRGRVRHVPSGEWRHFRRWEDLCVFLDTRSDDSQSEKYHE